jgi:hypothetical protein
MTPGLIALVSDPFAIAETGPAKRGLFASSSSAAPAARNHQRRISLWRSAMFWHLTKLIAFISPSSLN